MNNRIFPIISMLLFVVILNSFFVSAQGGQMGPAPYVKDIFATGLGGAEPVALVSPGDLLIINVKLGNLGFDPSFGLLTLYKRINFGIAEDEAEDTIYFVVASEFPAAEGWEAFADGEVDLAGGEWEIPDIVWNDSEITYEIPFEVPALPDGSTIELGAEMDVAGPDSDTTDNTSTTTVTVQPAVGVNASFITPANGATYNVGDTVYSTIDVYLPSGYWMDSSVNPTLDITGQPQASLGHFGGINCDSATRTCSYSHSWDTTGKPAGSYTIAFTGTWTQTQSFGVGFNKPALAVAPEEDYETIYFSALIGGDLGDVTVPDGFDDGEGETYGGDTGGTGGGAAVPPIVTAGISINLSGGTGGGGAADYTPGTPEWSSFHGNESNNGRSNTSYTNVDDVNERWAHDTGGVVLSSPAIASNVTSGGETKTLLFIGSGDGNLYALDVDTLTGSPVAWTAMTGGPIRSSPTFLAGVDVKDTSEVGPIISGNQGFSTVESMEFAEEDKDTLYFIAVAVGPNVSELPIVQKDIVIIGSNDGAVHCFDASDGTKIWQQNILGGMPVLASATPFTITLGDGTSHEVVYTMNDTGRATAIDVSNGSIWWARTLQTLGGNAGGKATPAAMNLPWVWKAIAGSGSQPGGLNEDLDAVIGVGPGGAAGSGFFDGEEEEFDIDGDGMLDTVQRWRNVDAVFYADLGGYITAIDAVNGDILWRKPPFGFGGGGAQFIASPIIMDIAINYAHPNLGGVTTAEVIIVTDTISGTIYVVDAHNGFTIGSLSAVQGISATPTINGTNAFIATDDGKMYKTNIATAATGLTSTPVSMSESITKASSPVLVGGNNILVSTCYSKDFLMIDETHDGEIWKFDIAGNSWTKIYSDLGANGNCNTYDWISSIAATDTMLFVGTTGGSPGEVVGLGEGIDLPDLTTSITSVSSTSVTIGNSFDVNCTTTNGGSGDAATSSTSVYLNDGTPSDENPTGALSSGSATSGTANNFTLSTVGLAEGTYTLRCEADIDGEIEEEDEENNIATHGVQIDLSESTAPPTVSITSPLTDATVSGTINITGTSAIHVDSPLGTTISSVNLEGGPGNVLAGGTTNWSYMWDTTDEAEGATTISAIATDSLGNVGVFTIDVTVDNEPDTSGKPDLAISPSDISITPSGPYSVGQTVTISATVKNLGIAAIVAGITPTVHFYQGDPTSGGTLIATKTVGALAATGIAGSSSTATAQWTIPAAGSFDIYVVIDKDNLIDESVD